MSSKQIPPPPPLTAHERAPKRTTSVPAARVHTPDTRFSPGVITRSHTERDEKLRTRDFARMMATTRYGTSR